MEPAPNVALNSNLLQGIEQNIRITSQFTQPQSTSKSDSSIAQLELGPGNKIKDSLGGSPSGSGSDPYDFSGDSWSEKAFCPNPADIISSPEFWNSYLNPENKDSCPKKDED